MDSLLLVETVGAVLRLQELRAEVAARNIAMHNVPSARVERFDASTQFQQLKAALNDADAMKQQISGIRSASSSRYVSDVTEGEFSGSLDALVLEMTMASERYQTLSEGLTRQFALMKLSITGGR